MTQLKDESRNKLTIDFLVESNTKSDHFTAPPLDESRKSRTAAFSGIRHFISIIHPIPDSHLNYEIDHYKEKQVLFNPDLPPSVDNSPTRKFIYTDSFNDLENIDRINSRSGNSMITPLSSPLSQKWWWQKSFFIRNFPCFSSSFHLSHSLRVAIYILTYYTLSITVSFYNKYVIGKNAFNFPYPILAASVHTVIHAFLSGLFLTVSYLRKRNALKNLNSSTSFPLTTLIKSKLSFPWKKKGTYAQLEDGTTEFTPQNSRSDSKDDGYKNPIVADQIDCLSTISLYQNSVKDFSTSRVASTSEEFPLPSLDMNTSAFKLFFLFSPTSWADYLRRIVPCGLAAGLDISLSNASLRLVSLSVYTMVKSSVPIFALLASFIFGLEKPRLSLFLIMGLIGFGVLLTTLPPSFSFVQTDIKEEQFSSFHDSSANFEGCLIVLGASIMSGLRWTLAQLLMNKPSSSILSARNKSIIELNILPNVHSSKNQSSSRMSPTHFKSPFDSKYFPPLLTMFHISPVIALTCFILALSLESLFQLPQSEFFNTAFSAMLSIGIMVFGGLMTFGLILAELLLVEATSVVTLSITGIFKEIVIIVFSVLIFNDSLSSLNIFGLVISLVGIAIYNYYRFTMLSKMLEKASNSVSYSSLNNSSYNLPEAILFSHSSTFVQADIKMNEKTRGDEEFLPFPRSPFESPFSYPELPRNS